MNLNFQRFVGIDWSGAEKDYRKKIAVAVCGNGDEDPELRDREGWTRTQVFEKILGEFATNTLIGIDFAFSYPHVDLGAYFPGDTRSPESPQALWALIDQGVHSGKDFYGRRFAHGWAKEYYQLSEEMTGSKYEERFRVTDRMCHKRGAPAQSVFKLWGPGHVGTGTLAGMRVLHKLQVEYADRIAIWPFDEFQDKQTVIVEIYPRLFWETKHVPRPPSAIQGCALSPDEKAAWISATALRQFHKRPELWQPPMTKEVLSQEGWIFGSHCLGVSA